MMRRKNPRDASRRIVIGTLTMCAILATLALPAGAFGIAEIGLCVSIDRLEALTSAAGAWHVTLRAFVRTELDAVWTMDLGLGLDVARMAPAVTIGLSRDLLQSVFVAAGLGLEWVPRYGIAAALDTGLCYHPTISEGGQLILETFPVHWQIVSVDHRYVPVPELRLSFALGANLLLEHGGRFGEVLTIEGYKIEDRRLPFSLFVGNGWYLTLAEFTTRVGYEL